MMWITTAELVDTVRRNLLDVVAPTLDDEFTRVQVLAAVHALAEVHDRLESGDPVEAENTALDELLRSWGKPGVDLTAADVRAENTAARERIRETLASTDEPQRLLAEFTRVEAAVAENDLPWMSREAMATLE